jgi:thioredoxin-like negative regulator of GroEL
MSQLTPLQTQEQFEILIGRVATKEPVPSFCVVYFTAKWCGACKRLDLNKIISAAPNAFWLKCDIDENKYTLGYCGLSKIPSFALIKDGKFLGKFTSSDIGMIFDMLEQAFS